MKYYAQINEEDICVGVQSSPGKIDNGSLIEITEQAYSSDILGSRYEKGGWLPQPKPPMPRMATNAETLQAINSLYAELMIGGVI